MTLTETRPEPTAGATPIQAPAASGTPDFLLTTGDHKHVGLLLLAGGVLALVAASVVAALFALPGVEDGIDVWTRLGSRVASAATATAFVLGIPAAWLGLMTHVVPLQIGASRFALPRLQALAAWAWIAGAVCVGIALAADDPGFNLGQILPPVAEPGAAASDGTELLIAGLLLVALATAGAALGVVATILTHRAEGMTFARLPVFTWTSLAAGITFLLATPVFVVGLTLLYLDQHYGGTLFDGSSLGGLRVWQHQLWLFARPEAFLLLAPGLGAIADITATRAGRPLVAFPVARAAAVFATFWSLIAWATPFGALTSVVPPTTTVATALIAVPAGVVVLACLATLAAGTIRFHGSLALAAAHVVLVGAAIVMPLVAAVVGVESEDASAFANAQLTVVLFGGPITAIAAAVHHWAPKLAGREAPSAVALLQALLLVGGTVVAALPGYLVGLDAGDTDLAPIATAGFAAAALALLLFLPLLGGRPAGDVAADPSGQGLTLEWAAPSPPPPHNFETLPPITSPHPLHQGADR